MRNIKLIIEYDGTNYSGWQIQPYCKTIQGIIQDKLSIITKSPIKLTGSGRTDSGVHAIGQTANFKTESRMTSDQFQMALNSLLPNDIVIRHVGEVNENFNARYNAKLRTYRYTILNEKTSSAFLRNYTYLFPHDLDINAMNEACKFLIGTHDFVSFATTGDPVKNTVRIVTRAEVSIPESSGFDGRFTIQEFWSDRRMIHFEIQANGFLRCMVRAITGTLVEIGRGKIKPEEMASILLAKDRNAAGPSLPAKGLCLINVSYKDFVK
ncbi:tRNA pseudouridine(38-40) synthase TruA [Candidatus Poribacteria bacterium]|nr:tRNA pseudouridine(38-40) synthase TruA [Candidatus Poribacteria bacterium]